MQKLEKLKTLKELQVVSMLGPCCGTMGTVLLAKHHNRLLAVKKLDLDRTTEKELKTIQNELLLAKQMRHGHLLPIECSFVDDQCLYVVSPAAGFGSCADLIANHFPSGLSEAAVLLILRDIVQGLSYLHSRRLLHRAIRARHMLVTSSGRALLSCLRHAEYITPGQPCHVFSEQDADNLNWLSPEVLAQGTEGYDEKSDVYSVGMALLELVNGIAPYSDVSSTCMLVQKLSWWVPEFTKAVSPVLMQLREACTHQQVQFRPTAQQLLNVLKGKGDLGGLLHPVIPMDSHQVQADTDDLRAILANSHKSAHESHQNLDWTFE